MLSQFYRTCCCHHGYVFLSLYESSFVIRAFNPLSWSASWVQSKVDGHVGWKWTILKDKMNRTIDFYPTKLSNFKVHGLWGWKWTIWRTKMNGLEVYVQIALGFTLFGPNYFEDRSFLSLQIVHYQAKNRPLWNSTIYMDKNKRS